MMAMPPMKPISLSQMTYHLLLQEVRGFGKLSTFLKWHLEDPVSEEELARNESIAANYQQNRNPFIDFRNSPLLCMTLQSSARFSYCKLLHQQCVLECDWVGE